MLQRTLKRCGKLLTMLLASVKPRPDQETKQKTLLSTKYNKKLPTKLLTKIKNIRVQTKETLIVGNKCMTFDTRHLVFIKMWFEDDVAIAAAAAACVILSLKSKNIKKRFWVRPSILTRKQYSGSDLMIDLQRDDINLS